MKKGRPVWKIVSPRKYRTSLPTKMRKSPFLKVLIRDVNASSLEGTVCTYSFSLIVKVGTRSAASPISARIRNVTRMAMILPSDGSIAPQIKGAAYPIADPRRNVTEI